MRPRRFFWKLFLSHVALLTLTLLTCVALILQEFNRFYVEDTNDELQRFARAVREAVIDDLAIRDHSLLNERIANMVSDQPDTPRITLIAPDGRVLADTMHDHTTMEPHGDRPEVKAALRDGQGSRQRYSTTINRDLHYVALRIGNEAEPLGVVRVAMADRTIGMRGGAVRRLAWSIALTIAAAAALLAMGLATWWSRPIARLTAAARNIATGDLSARVDAQSRDEIGLLARSLNRMRSRLADQLATIDRQRETLESLLAQLSEGVIVADGGGRILLLNPQAARMLQVTPPRKRGGFVGLAVEECVPSRELQELLVQGPTASLPVEARVRESATAHIESRPHIANGSEDRDMETVRIRMEGPNGPMSMLAHASDIHLPGPPSGTSTPAPSTFGRLVVLTDVTELAQLIRIKTDFASNASHELRTPLSAIRAAVDTLRDMGDADGTSIAPVIDVIDRQSNRMLALVSDLLDLSRVEAAGKSSRTGKVSTRNLIAELHRTFAEPLATSRIELVVDVEGACETLMVDERMLRLVLRNLIDNALRFTPAEGRITVAARVIDSAVEISVADTGCGIPPKEQSRVFERFYQVERARSGASRGTGLGLSIVKHAVSAMRGSVHLTSKLGEGTTVFIRLPHDVPTQEATN